MILTRESRQIYKNRWMTLREDEIEREDGSTGVYSVVEKPDFSLILPLNNGAVTLVEQWRYPVGRRFPELPQGSWEHAPETDPLEVARGELREETGLLAGRMRFLGRLFNAYGFSTQAFHVFLAEDLTLTDASPDQEEQDLRTRTVSVAAFETMLREGEIQDAATAAAWMLYTLQTGMK